VQQLLRVLFEVSASPDLVAEVRSREKRCKTSGLANGSFRCTESAWCEVHGSNAVSFGDDGHIVYAELPGNRLVDLDEEFEVARGPAGDNHAHREAEASFPCEPDVILLDSPPTQACGKTNY
jgi:hypothetical protein